jgi:hypothetical protein
MTMTTAGIEPDREAFKRMSLPCGEETLSQSPDVSIVSVIKGIVEKVQVGDVLRREPAPPRSNYNQFSAVA